jgi:hypothetical protein
MLKAEGGGGLQISLHGLSSGLQHTLFPRLRSETEVRLRRIADLATMESVLLFIVH